MCYCVKVSNFFGFLFRSWFFFMVFLVFWFWLPFFWTKAERTDPSWRSTRLIRTYSNRSNSRTEWVTLFCGPFSSESYDIYKIHQYRSHHPHPESRMLNPILVDWCPPLCTTRRLLVFFWVFAVLIMQNNERSWKSLPKGHWLRNIKIEKFHSKV